MTASGGQRERGEHRESELGGRLMSTHVTAKNAAAGLVFPLALG
jgi:hypothetical protein